MDRIELNQDVDPQQLARRLAPWLDDLEERVDAVDEDRLLADWKLFADGAWPQPIFSPRRFQRSPPRIDWPYLSIDDAISNPHALLLRQFAECSRHLDLGVSRQLGWPISDN